MRSNSVKAALSPHAERFHQVGGQHGVASVVPMIKPSQGKQSVAPQNAFDIANSRCNQRQQGVERIFGGL